MPDPYQHLNLAEYARDRAQPRQGDLFEGLQAVDPAQYDRMAKALERIAAISPYDVVGNEVRALRVCKDIARDAIR